MPSKSVLPKKPTVIVRKKRAASAPPALVRPHSESLANTPMKSRASVANPPRSYPRNLETRGHSAPPPPQSTPPAPPTTPRVSPPVSPDLNQPTRKEREVQQQRAVLMLLQQRWPDLFPTDAQQKKPLAVGIHQELIEALPDIKPWRIRQVLGWWQWSARGAYWRALLKGGSRYHLDGTPSGQITPQEQAHAAQQLAALAGRQRERRSPASTSPADGAENLDARTDKEELV